MEPHWGQVGGTAGSMEMMVDTGGGGRTDGQLQEVGDAVHGEPQEQADQAHGGGGVPRVVVSGLDAEQVQIGEKLDKLNINKLILDWDVMAKCEGGETGLPGNEQEG